MNFDVELLMPLLAISTLLLVMFSLEQSRQELLRRQKERAKKRQRETAR